MRKRNGAPSELANRALSGPHRRHKRYRTTSLLIDNPVVGRVVNVGQSGFALEAPEGLSVGESYTFKVRLGEKHLRLSGRVQWCRLTSTESNGEAEALPVYKAGVALADDVASKAWRAALTRLTDESAYLIWHRARPKESSDTLADLQAGTTAPRNSDRLGL